MMCPMFYNAIVELKVCYINLACPDLMEYVNEVVFQCCSLSNGRAEE